MPSVLSIRNLGKSYASGHTALHDVDLDIEEGEIFALLGPNGAGKTTLISIVCGLVTASRGQVLVNGHDAVRDYRQARGTIGLVPQELHTDAFERVIDTVRFSRGLFGRPRNDALIERILRDLTLWDKRTAKMMELSGGMKRRVMIAKALAHEPRILFLDEPTAGVDVELRKDMWDLVRRLRGSGVTIILTTHYIEEAEEMADRVGVINKGRLMLVEEKDRLMRTLGRKTLSLRLKAPLAAVPEGLAPWDVRLAEGGSRLDYAYDEAAGESGDAPVAALMRAVTAAGVDYADISTRQSSLEDIFVGLVHRDEHKADAEDAA